MNEQEFEQLKAIQQRMDEMEDYFFAVFNEYDPFRIASSKVNFVARGYHPVSAEMMANAPYDIKFLLGLLLDLGVNSNLWIVEDSHG